MADQPTAPFDDEIIQVSSSSSSSSSSLMKETLKDLRSQEELKEIVVKLVYTYDQNTQIPKSMNALCLSNVRNTFTPTYEFDPTNIVNTAAFAFPQGESNIYKWGLKSSGQCSPGLATSLLLDKLMIAQKNKEFIAFLPLVDRGTVAINMKNGLRPGDNGFREPDIPNFNLSLGVHLIEEYQKHPNFEVVLMDPVEHLTPSITAGPTKIYHNCISLTEMYKESIRVMTPQLANISDPKIFFSSSTKYDVDEHKPMIFTFRNDIYVRNALNEMFHGQANYSRVEMLIAPGKYSGEHGQIAYPNRKILEQSIANILNSPTLFKTMAVAHNIKKYSKVYIVLDWFSASAYTAAVFIMAMITVCPAMKRNVGIIQVFKNKPANRYSIEELLGK
jgi:hypothetical protein